MSGVDPIACSSGVRPCKRGMILEVSLRIASKGVSASPFAASFDYRISLAHEYWLWPDSAVGYEEQ
jgi:hypothetical protein